MIPLVLRFLAIAIAIVALVDPEIRTQRATRPDIALIAGTADSVLATHVADALGDEFNVVRGPLPGAAGSVLVGTALPADLTVLAEPFFALIPDGLTLTSVAAPPRAPVDARVPVTVAARVAGVRGGAVEFTLKVRGVVVDRAQRTVSGADTTVSATLSYAPPAAGTIVLSAEARVAGQHRIAGADVAIDVVDTRYAILFFDPRPSWMSTFVRRTIERDARFVVTSRVVTSRSISTDVGRPPASLDDLAALELFDAVVVGAPEALSERDVGGLNAFLRRRGGGVVMLFDERAPGAYERLTEVARWDAAGTRSAIPISSDGGPSLRTTELAWPVALPDGAQPVALDSAQRRAVVWRSAVGAGQLVVSGAMTSWHLRDESQSDFNEYWPALIADIAAASQPAIRLHLHPPIATPGERIAATVVMRDTTIRAAATALGFKLYPEGSTGRFTGYFRAPTIEGTHRIAVSAGGGRAEQTLVVASGTATPVPDERGLLRIYAESHAGRVVPADELRSLPEVLSAAVKPQQKRATSYPMRSAWWIVPFALLLSAEWYARRRQRIAA